MKMRILALGNRIMGDDAVGLVVGERLMEDLGSFDIVLLEEGGVALMDYLDDVDKVIIVDSFETDEWIGQVRLMDVEEASSFLRGSHYMGFGEVVELVRKLTGGKPKDVHVIAIGVKDTRTIKEGLSDELLNRLDGVVSEVKRIILDLIDASDINA